MDLSTPRPKRLRLRQLTGELPPFNEWTRWVVDHDALQAYVYGGCRPGDEDETPTNDFYVLDMENNPFKWKNLNPSLRYHTPDPFFGQRLVPRQLPALRQPAVSFAILNSRRFIFIFGGFSQEHDRVSSDLIAVDLRSNEWSHVFIEGGPVDPRMDAAMAIIGNKLFIFGGRSNFDDSTILRSYSIAEYSERTPGWAWTHKDVPYPPKVPNLGYKMGAIPMSGETKILLFPGRVEYDEPFNIIQSRVLSFSTEDHCFTPLQIPAIQYPGHVTCYDALRFHTNLPSANLALIAGWISQRGYIVPELWFCNPLAPGQVIKRLHLHHAIFELDLDLHISITCQNRAFIFGYDNGDGEDYVDPPPDSTWNSCVEVVFHAEDG